MTVGESHLAKEMPPGSGHLIMHAVFKKGDMQILGSDMMRDKAILGDNVSIMVEFDNEKELNMPSGTNVTVSWQSVAGINYFLERSTNLLWASAVFHAPVAQHSRPGRHNFLL